MNVEKDYYVEWRGERDRKFREDRDFHTSAERFFGATKADEEYFPGQTAHQLAKETAKQQIASRTTHLFNRKNDWHNPDKTQAGIFYDDTNFQGLSEEQRMDIERKSHASNGLFKPTTYSSEQWRAELMTSTTTADHNPGQFADLNPDMKFNLRRTPISEYSNALHNNTVFINPRFTSC